MGRPACGVRLVIIITLAIAGCSSVDEQLRQHRQKLESLGATARAIGEAWLAGTVSRTYTTTALKETGALLDKLRSEFGAAPELLADPRGAELSQQSERLARLLALMAQDVTKDDRASVRSHVAQIPVHAGGQS